MWCQIIIIIIFEGKWCQIIMLGDSFCFIQLWW